MNILKYIILLGILILQGCAGGYISESKYAYDMKKDIILVFPAWVSKEAKLKALRLKGEKQAKVKCGLNKEYQIIDIENRKWLENGIKFSDIDGKRPNSIGGNILCTKSCNYNPEKCDNEKLCYKATILENDNKVWEKNSRYSIYVTEAKSRGLLCDTIIIKPNKIDAMLKYALKRLIQLNISSTSQVDKVKQIIFKMNKNKFNNLYQLCKNAFANSEGSKCDVALNKLN